MSGPLIATGNDIYPTEPTGMVTGIELRPCECDANGETVPCAPDRADFWSVYLRYAPAPGSGGADCVGDFLTEHDARLFAGFLAALLRVPFGEPDFYRHSTLSQGSLCMSIS